MDRAAFREAVFSRDGGRCVFCAAPAVDAHHLLERRLWSDGGYIPDNGISVCGVCHVLCEQTLYSVEEGRAAADITTVVVPEHLYADQAYDKWGNLVLPDGLRSPGELFDDESVQKILREGGVVGRFVPYVKYPRTYHLPWSHAYRDDRSMALDDVARAFEGKDVVVTEKMDGENTTLYSDKIHSRAIDGAHHPSQGWVKNFWSTIAHDIPHGWRVCGENLYARHSISYDDLPSYFLGFSIWDWLTCLSWDETVEWFDLLGVTPVPVLYEGIWDEALIRGLTEESDRVEGYVVRLRSSFSYRDFRTSVAKFVRNDHLRTPERWSRQVEANGMALRTESKLRS